MIFIIFFLIIHFSWSWRFSSTLSVCHCKKHFNGDFWLYWMLKSLSLSNWFWSCEGEWAVKGLCCALRGLKKKRFGAWCEGWFGFYIPKSHNALFCNVKLTPFKIMHDCEIEISWLKLWSLTDPWENNIPRDLEPGWILGFITCGL